MDGLSPAEVRVLLQTEPPKGTYQQNVSDNDVVWQAEYHTQGVWVATQFLYTSEVPHEASRETIWRLFGRGFYCTEESPYLVTSPEFPSFWTPEEGTWLARYLRQTPR
jgi:hypothetical protein